MEFLKLPKNFFTDLNLPGKKPLGPVEVDWNHKYSKGLTFVAVINQGKVVDLISGESGTPTGTPVFGVGRDGKKVAFDPGGPFTFPNISKANTKFNDGFTKDNGFSVAIGLQTTIAQARVILEKGTTEQIVVQETGSGNLLWQTTVSGISSLSTFAISDGLPHNCVFTAKDIGTSLTRHKIFIDGELDVSESRSYEMPAPNTNDFVVGARAGGSSPLEGDIYYLFIWDHELEDNVARELTADPYQILKPIEPINYFTSTTAGTTINTTLGILSLTKFDTTITIGTVSTILATSETLNLTAFQTTINPEEVNVFMFGAIL